MHSILIQGLLLLTRYIDLTQRDCKASGFVFSKAYASVLLVQLCTLQMRLVRMPMLRLKVKRAKTMAPKAQELCHFTSRWELHRQVIHSLFMSTYNS
jgi:hypothetical protein